MSRKCITVPKTAEAEMRLDLDEAMTSELLKYNFNRDEEFYRLHETDIFKDINEACGSMVADFESDELKSEEMKLRCLNVLTKKSVDADSEISIILKEIIELTEEAIKRNTGIYFFF